MVKRDCRRPLFLRSCAPRSRERSDRRSREEAPREALALGAALPAVLEELDKRGSLALLQLWAHWEMVLGPELAPLAHPLGHHKDILVIGVDDHLAQQELAFQTEEILERVNAFLDAPLFTGVTLTLLQGRSILDEAVPPRFPPLKAPPLFEAPQAENVGGLLDFFDPDTPIGRCYRRCVERCRRERP